MTPIELVAAIGDNEAALNALPDDLRNAVLAAKKEKEESDRRMAEAEREARKREDEKERARRDKERKELLCIGTWAEDIPRNRRFALCERDWKRYAEYVTGGWRYNDPHELVPVKELCAVDIVRGYTSPYFGYYCGDGEAPHQLRSWWKQRLQPVIEAETEDDCLKCIRAEWNFFHIYNDCPDEPPFPFRILTYEVGDDGDIKITGRSEAKKWQEHRADLEKEFAK